MIEIWNTLASVGTFIVITATAVAAAIQLRHLRRNNELQSVLALRSERSPHLEEAVEFVSTQLEERLRDPVYRDELEAHFAPSRRSHKELVVADYYEHIGTYVKRKLIAEDVYFEVASPGRYWSLIEPAIAIYRRKRGPTAYENLSFSLYANASGNEAHPAGALPKGLRRAHLSDVYFEADRMRHGRPVG